MGLRIVLAAPSRARPGTTSRTLGGLPGRRPAVTNQVCGSGRTRPTRRGAPPLRSGDLRPCWLRGMRTMRLGTREADLEARRDFERALSIDPAYARAHSGLSLSYFNDWSCAAWDRWDENERKAFEHALEAARLDEHDHVTHCILGRILVCRREFERAAEHLARALALNPNDPDVLAHLALGRAYLGEPELGLELGSRRAA